MKENCASCARNVLNEKVPRSVYETAQAQANVDKRRLFITLLVTILLLVATNLAWIVYESQFEIVETREYDVQQEIQNDNGDAFITGVGDVNYGESKTESHGEDNEDADP